MLLAVEVRSADDAAGLAMGAVASHHAGRATCFRSLDGAPACSIGSLLVDDGIAHALVASLGADLDILSRLLEEERHIGFRALVAQRAQPRDVARPRARA